MTVASSRLPTLWRIEGPLALVPRTVTVTDAHAREFSLPTSWTEVDVCVDGRVVLPGLGNSEFRRDGLAVDFDPFQHEHRGHWALRRAGGFVLAIPHFDGPRVERFFPPPAHLGTCIPALGPSAYAFLAEHLALPPSSALSALSAAEWSACLLRNEPSAPFAFDTHDVPRFAEDRVVAVTERDREQTCRSLATFLAKEGISERALSFVPLHRAEAVELWIDSPQEQVAYRRFAVAADRWGFLFPELDLAGFPPEDGTR